MDFLLLVLPSYLMRKMTGIFRALIFITLLGPAALGTPIVEPRQASSCENSATTRNCWAEYDIDTDYYVSWPHTGVTREVSRMQIQS